MWFIDTYSGRTKSLQPLICRVYRELKLKMVVIAIHSGESSQLNLKLMDQFGV